MEDNKLKRSVGKLTVREYRSQDLRPVYEDLVSPPYTWRREDLLKQKQLDRAIDIYDQWSSGRYFETPVWDKVWKKDPYLALKAVRGPKCTEYEGRLGAAKILPYLIERLEKDPDSLNRAAFQLWLNHLKRANRPELSFGEFSDHVSLELAVFESSELDTDLKSYLVHITPFMNLRRYSFQVGDGIRQYSYPVDDAKDWTPSAEDRQREREFYKELGLESQIDVGMFLTALFRRAFFEALRVAISNF